MARWGAWNPPRGGIEEEEEAVEVRGGRGDRLSVGRFHGPDL